MTRSSREPLAAHQGRTGANSCTMPCPNVKGHARSVMEYKSGLSNSWRMSLKKDRGEVLARGRGVQKEGQEQTHGETLQQR